MDPEKGAEKAVLLPREVDQVAVIAGFNVKPSSPSFPKSLTDDKPSPTGSAEVTAAHICAYQAIPMPSYPPSPSILP
jgi:hypothetical protein